MWFLSYGDLYVILIVVHYQTYDLSCKIINTLLNCTAAVLSAPAYKKKIQNLHWKGMMFFSGLIIKLECRTLYWPGIHLLDSLNCYMMPLYICIYLSKFRWKGGPYLWLCICSLNICSNKYRIIITCICKGPASSVGRASD